jgi:flagellin-like protein
VGDGHEKGMLHRGKSGFRGARRKGRSRRGVSDVVATILLLALTVTLFSSIFFFVTTFPPPPPQSTSQFSAALILTANQSYVQGITITHLAGPSVTVLGTQVYFKSARFPSAAEFQNPVPASAGLGAAKTWNLGQTFNYTFPCPTLPTCEQPILPDNITVLVTSSTLLLFSTVLPGQQIHTPPVFLTTSVSPANPVPNGAFTVYATTGGNLGGATVYLNLVNVNGLSSAYPVPVPMTFNAATDVWSYAVTGGHGTTNGTYFAFVNVTNSFGQSATAGVTIPIAGTGSSTSSLLSVAVVQIPQPPVLPASSGYFAAVVTYYGTNTNLALAVNFWVNQTPVSKTAGVTFGVNSQTLSAPSGLTISGPSTETVYSTSPATFTAWLFNSSVTVSASGTVTGVGSAAGQTSYTEPTDVQGIIFTTLKTWAHGCTTGCPFLNVTVWDNWSTAITFAGKAWANGTGKGPYTIASTAVAAGGSTTISLPGVHTRFSGATKGGPYTLVLVLTVTAGGVTVGYIADSFVITSIT